tara:strand:- start:218 stop:622 length:405 start_codon:yes stop_codon:yes gene_type:complete
MIKSRFKKPYRKDGKTNFPHTTKKSGVYLIADKNGKIVYVGFSLSNLYKTMYRHFQSWKDWRQERATFSRKTHKVRVVFTTPKQAQKLERALIVKYKPKGNPDKLLDYTISKAESKIKDEYLLENTTNFEDIPF